jgi:hypothetical protein
MTISSARSRQSWTLTAPAETGPTKSPAKRKAPGSPIKPITAVIKALEVILATTVVFAAGGAADDGLYQALAGRIAELHCIGDAYQARDIEVAVVDGHRVGRAL